MNAPRIMTKHTASSTNNTQEAKLRDTSQPKFLVTRGKGVEVGWGCVTPVLRS